MSLVNISDEFLSKLSPQVAGALEAGASPEDLLECLCIGRAGATDIWSETMMESREAAIKTYYDTINNENEIPDFDSLALWVYQTNEEIINYAATIMALTKEDALDPESDAFDDDVELISQNIYDELDYNASFCRFGIGEILNEVYRRYRLSFKVDASFSEHFFMDSSNKETVSGLIEMLATSGHDISFVCYDAQEVLFPEFVRENDRICFAGDSNIANIYDHAEFPDRVLIGGR